MYSRDKSQKNTRFQGGGNYFKKEANGPINTVQNPVTERNSSWKYMYGIITNMVALFLHEWNEGTKQEMQPATFNQ